MDIIKNYIFKKENKINSISNLDDNSELKVQSKINFIAIQKNKNKDENEDDKINTMGLKKNNDSNFYNNNGYKFYSNAIKKNIMVLSEHNNIIERIKGIIAQENSSDIYQKKILKYFNGYAEFIGKKKKRKGEKKRNAKNIKEGNYYLNQIDITEVYRFVNYKYKNYKYNTKNIILSSMRNFVRILNNDKNINYKKKISFQRPIKNSISLTENEQVSLVNNLKKNNDIQNLIILYFLYYSGLTFSLLSRFKISDFKKGFSFIKIVKGTKKIIKIPSVIQKNILTFFREKENKSLFFFYDSFYGDKNLSRTKYLKIKFIESLNSVHAINESKKDALIKDFSKSRKFKILTYKYFTLFDFENKNINNSIIKELPESPEEQNSFFSISLISEFNESDSDADNIEIISNNKEKEINFQFRPKNNFKYKFSKDDSFFDERQSNRFFRERAKTLFKNHSNKDFEGEKNNLK